MTEKETRFTPGPWKAFPEDRGGGGYGKPYCTVRTDGRSYESICHVMTHDHAFDRDMPFDANAHLIAAAPDLYEALVFAREQLEHYEQQMSGETFNSLQINAALSKALGETP